MALLFAYLTFLPVLFFLKKMTSKKILPLPTPQNDQTHSNNSSGVVDELFECVRPFCGVGIQKG